MCCENHPFLGPNLPQSRIPYADALFEEPGYGCGCCDMIWGLCPGWVRAKYPLSSAVVAHDIALVLRFRGVEDVVDMNGAMEVGVILAALQEYVE